MHNKKHKQKEKSSTVLCLLLKSSLSDTAFAQNIHGEVYTFNIFSFSNNHQTSRTSDSGENPPFRDCRVMNHMLMFQPMHVNEHTKCKHTRSNIAHLSAASYIRHYYNHKSSKNDKMCRQIPSTLMNICMLWYLKDIYHTH